MKGIETIVNILFIFVGKHIKGYRTMIVAFATFFIGAWQWVTGSGLFGFLCTASDTFKPLAMFCNIDATSFYSIILTVVGVLNVLLRKLTDTPSGEAGTSNLVVGRRRRLHPVIIVLGVILSLILIFVFIPLLINYVR